jgi:hypothetical protein
LAFDGRKNKGVELISKESPEKQMPENNEYFIAFYSKTGCKQVKIKVSIEK